MLFKNMRDQLITADELRSQARQQGIADISNIEFACLEGNGEISFVQRNASNQGKHKRRREQAV